MTLADLAAKFRDARPLPGGGWEAHCSAHDDRRRSLSIGTGKDGRHLIHCHAGCAAVAVLSEAGLKFSDLHEGTAPADESSPKRRIVAAYEYRDEKDSLLFEVVRFEPKGFSQRRPDGKGGWIYNLSGARRVLYRLPELVAADPTAFVYLPEGEKDADAVAVWGGIATCNPGGAGKWRAEYAKPLRGRHVVVLPDNDDPGRVHAEAVARSLHGIAASVRVLALPGVPEKGDVSDWLSAGGTLAQLQALAAGVPPGSPREENGPAAKQSPWTAAQSAAAFIATTEPDVLWLEENILAPGSLTELFAPRGIGKTHVALGLAVKLSRAGRRVLILDRDNSKREVRRRLRAWGAAETTTLMVMLRDDVPPLTDTAAWKVFPFTDYDLVVVDSIDSATEGVGEQDSSKPSRALAPLLDVCHCAAGPAVLVLGNTVKSDAHARGSGVIEDRGDIVFEIRDATGFTPSGTEAWWVELAKLTPGGRGSYGERAERRKQRECYRLAFVPSKFRIGEEPEPFVLEINLAGDPWSLANVTDEMLAGGREAAAKMAAAHAAMRQAAADALVREITGRADRGAASLKHTEAVERLMDAGLTRQKARTLIKERDGRDWIVAKLEHEQGKPRVLRPRGVGETAQITPSRETPVPPTVSEPSLSAAHEKPDGTNRRPENACNISLSEGEGEWGEL